MDGQSLRIIAGGVGIGQLYRRSPRSEPRPDFYTLLETYMTTQTTPTATGWIVFRASPWKLAMMAGSFDEAAMIADGLDPTFRIAYGARVGRHDFVPLAEPEDEVAPGPTGGLS
jgi:hypothetical protein